MKKKRIQIAVNTNRRTKNRLDKMCQEFGMTQAALINALINEAYMANKE